MLSLPPSISTIPIFSLLLALTATFTSAAISFTPKVYCANYPGKVAGSMISARHPPSHPHAPRSPNLLPNPDLSPRDSGPIYWCAPSSRTYIVLHPAHPLAGPSVANMLTAASASIATQIQDHGDGVIGGDWNFKDGEGADLVRMRTYDAGGEHTTWGVLGAAIAAFGDWVKANGGTAGMVEIYDGKNQVGAGFLG